MEDELVTGKQILARADVIAELLTKAEVPYDSATCYALNSLAISMLDEAPSAEELDRSFELVVEHMRQYYNDIRPQLLARMVNGKATRAVIVH